MKFFGIVEKEEYIIEPRKQRKNSAIFIVLKSGYGVGDPHGFRMDAPFHPGSDVYRSIVNCYKPTEIRPLFKPFSGASILELGEPEKANATNSQFIGWAIVPYQVTEEPTLAQELLLKELNEYNQYLLGNTYKYSILDSEDNKVVESSVASYSKEEAYFLMQKRLQYYNSTNKKLFKPSPLGVKVCISFLSVIMKIVNLEYRYSLNQVNRRIWEFQSTKNQGELDAYIAMFTLLQESEVDDLNWSLSTVQICNAIAWLYGNLPAEEATDAHEYYNTVITFNNWIEHLDVEPQYKILLPLELVEVVNE